MHYLLLLFFFLIQRVYQLLQTFVVLELLTLLELEFPVVYLWPLVVWRQPVLIQVLLFICLLKLSEILLNVLVKHPVVGMLLQVVYVWDIHLLVLDFLRLLRHQHIIEVLPSADRVQCLGLLILVLQLNYLLRQFDLLITCQVGRYLLQVKSTHLLHLAAVNSELSLALCLFDDLFGMH